MRVLFKIMDRLLEQVRLDLLRPHAFAAERVGFLVCGVAKLAPSGTVILAHSFRPVEDTDYVDDPTVGAMMGPGAIRKALEFALNNKVGMFHVHMHDHSGRTRFSLIDARESARFVPDFWNVRPGIPHGAAVLSRNSAFGMCWHPAVPVPIEIDEFVVVGSPMFFTRNSP